MTRGRLVKLIKRIMKRDQRLIRRLGMAATSEEPVTLETSVRGRRTYYYRVIWPDGKRKRKYIGAAESQAVHEIVANNVRMARIRILSDNYKKMQEFIGSLQEDSVDAVQGLVKHADRKIVEECFLDWRLEELKAWAAAPYVKNNASFPKRVITAKDGTRLRSKGEVFWYDLLTELGIPFRFDCRITVLDRDGNKVYEYPDFLIQCYDGTYIIIEHFGKLGDDDYLFRQADKIQNYLRKGFVLGESFFVTSDDIHGGTREDAMESLLWRIEELFYFGGGTAMAE